MRLQRVLPVVVAAAAIFAGHSERLDAAPFLFSPSIGLAPAGELHVVTTTGTITLKTSDSPITKIGLLEYKNQGWWSPTILNVDINESYMVGNLLPFADFNNFFTFDITPLHGLDVVSATLMVRRLVGSFPPDELVTWYLFDVSTDPLTLNNNVGVSAAIYEDLRSGFPYGKTSLQTFGLNPFELISVGLNGNAISDIEKAALSGTKYFSIGGTLDPNPIPEPGGMTLAVIGSLLLGGASRWRRRHNSATAAGV